jgi:hypothetical protein
MRGTRYGDFYRFGFDSAKGYTGVLAQQGRVQLDADFNDQRAIVNHMIEVVLGDLLGSSWAPAAAPGFHLRPKVARSFEGGDRLLLDDSGALAASGSAEHTLELWLTWSGGAAVLVDCRNGDGSLGYELAIEESGTVVLALSVRQGGGSTLRLYSAEPVSAGKPLHLALVVGEDFAALFAGGRQVARGRHSGVSNLNEPVVVFGGPSRDSSPSHGFRGSAAAIRVWRTARTVAQLAEAAVAELTVVEASTDPGLLAAWTVDQSGEPSLDDTAAGRTATIGGGGSANWQLVDLTIDPGRFYLDGVLCELAAATSYTSQPGLAEPSLPDSGVYLAYLEIWEESVSAAEDASLRDVALGGLDTTVRTRIASRVRLKKIEDDADAATALTPPDQAKSGQLMAEHTGHTAPGNQLYRVEIHASGPLGGQSPATFKWSRDNGASVFGVTANKSDVVKLVYAAAGVPPLVRNDVVEALPAGAPIDGPAHPLMSVIDVSAADGTVTLNATPPAGTTLLRRWNNPRPGSATAAPVTGAELPVDSTWIGLEDGIRVRFEGDAFCRGDYWWFVSRIDTGTIEWEQQAGHPKALPPDGVERLRAPLARLSLQDGGVKIEDLRQIISPILARRPPARAWGPGSRPGAPPQEPSGDLSEGELEELALELGLEELDAIEDEETPLADEETGPASGGEDDDGEFASAELDVSRPEPSGPELRTLDWEEEELAEAEGVASELASKPEPEASEWAEREQAERGQPEPERRPTREAGWSHVGNLELSGGRLSSAAGIAESIVLITERGLFALSVADGEATQLGPLPKPRHGSGSQLVAIGQQLLLVGGGPEQDRSDGRMFIFDLEVGDWAECASIPVRHAHAAVAVARGRLHVIGGHSQAMRQRVHGTHHIYDPSHDRWSEALALPTPRAGAAAAAIGDRVHVVGGRSAARGAPAHVAHEAFDIDTGSWHAEPPLPEARPVISSAAHRGRHVLGLAGSEGHPGSHPRHAGPAASHVVAFDPASKVWEQLAPLPPALRDPIMVSHDGRLFVLGTGEDRSVEIHELS